jgi:hypothetical protein
MVAGRDSNPLCVSCRLTLTIPNQSLPENQMAWVKLESAKRTWLYTVLGLKLPVRSRLEDPKRGLAFHFLRQVDAAKPVFTGHELRRNHHQCGGVGPRAEGTQQARAA